MAMKKEVLIHISAWLFYILFQVIIFTPTGSFFLANFIDILISFLSFAVVFYLYALFIMPRFYKRSNYLLGILIAVVAFLFFILFHYLHHYYFMPLLDADGFGKAPMRDYLLRFVWWYFYYGIIGVGYWALMNNIAAQKRKSELEKSLLEAEIAFLKYQFNPHFLYNTLNFIYSKAFPISQDISNAVLLLTDIMRYALQGSPGEKVPLSRELQHLENFLKLHRLRFNDKIYINYSVEGDPSDVYIVPLILISFVENAFKHGQLNNVADPLVIKVDIEEDKISFYTKNKKNTSVKVPSTGIGLNNVRRRLNLRYGDNYRLDIADEDHYFSCNLEILENAYDLLPDR